MLSLEFAAGMFKLKEDLRAMLLSQGFLHDVVRQQGPAEARQHYSDWYSRYLKQH